MMNPDRLFASDLLSVLDFELNSMEKIRKRVYERGLHQLEKLQEELKEEHEKIHNRTEKDPGQLEDPALIRELTRRLYRQYREDLITLSARGSLPSWVEETLDLAGQKSEEWKEKPSLQAFYEEGKIHLALPPLPHRNRPELSFSTSSGAVPLRSTRLFASECEAAMEKLMLSAAFPLQEFTEKTIHYVFVFPEERFQMDNDHRDTEGVTNALIRYLPGGDSPLFCRFFYESALQQDLPEGTYVTVYPGKMSPEVTEKVLEFWRKKMP